MVEVPKHPHDESQQPQSSPPITIHASLFFDGTLNNWSNTLARVDPNDPQHQNYLSNQANTPSYANDFSNVARLCDCLVLDPAQNTADQAAIKIYVEGIGTTNFQDDSTAGYVAGVGATGVYAKVASGISQLISQVEGIVTDKTVQITLNIDTFGFSRGAAAARNCVWSLVTDYAGNLVGYGSNDSLKTKLQNDGYTVAAVNIKFAGLFDTVGSYGMSVVTHSSDANVLHLSMSVPEKVFQIAAADEHRVNFPLTNIDSAGGKGTQIFLPGVHCDIGGAYTQPSDETNLIILQRNEDPTGSLGALDLEKAKAALIAAGWYVDAEFAPIDGNYLQLTVTRTGICNDYSYIALQMMAKNSPGLNFGTVTQDYPIPDDLQTANANLQGGVTGAIAWDSDPDWIINLRHKYLHFSAHHDNSVFDPHRPRFVDSDGVDTTDELGGARKRKIY